MSVGLWLELHTAINAALPILEVAITNSIITKSRSTINSKYDTLIDLILGSVYKDEICLELIHSTSARISRNLTEF